MRHRTSSSDGYSSTNSSPTTRQRTLNHPPRPTSLRSRHRASQPSQPSPFGPMATLVRLAIFAAILAFTVPYIKPYIFGSSSATTSSDLVKNTTGELRAVKNSYHHVSQRNTDTDNQTNEQGEIDVFNFRHEDYLSSAKGLVKEDGNKNKKDKDVAKPSAVGVVAQSRPKTRSSRPTNQHSSYSNDFDHDKDSTNHHNQASTLLTIITNILSILYNLVRILLQFILIIPLTHIFHFTLYLITTFYNLIRLVVSHVLRPIVYMSAPLTYLFSGILFVFILTPWNLVERVVVELYPVYVFLGVATVVGVAMGLVAAGVLYFSAFIFVDRVQGSASNQVVGKGKKRLMEEDLDFSNQDASSSNSTPPTNRHGLNQTEFYPYQQQQGGGGYFSPSAPPTASFNSPRISPSLQYRSYSNSAV
ncbi:uncharacterized protein UTRI_03418 [Ustilago trichophora]|uniref:Uncharacterized protein n=1 Tax=Ustilago trichophora TaxID=86804 RepID=A0A5C3E256_9BASI|nr:uncharacterized protein UTRI_03418 [Ustilago trichophora]